MNEEEIAYLAEIFGKRNIEFVCEIQPEEEIDEDEDFWNGKHIWKNRMLEDLDKEYKDYLSV